MLPEYDFSQAIKNPYAKRLKSKKVVTIRIDDDAIDYFKQLSAEMDMPYQTLINLYLKECAETRKKPNIHWQ
ncbi:antitoxin [Lonepinella koalarum]|uniref:BrnA antitoxin of type II toxin-antitoxin system n=1 Tax=Lonepinella koalarum TaxID=53417 RepID=A0A4R1L0P9_9PAST|nr:BrnA antitoxin family protein [Lonepinella koalarum]MDH2926881.1 antitoxin [Lonepinella koalarum]TCK70460.1 BrnA antitoxin of type II toxin-antitoxin system [Lonepinella koalarum]TFJ90153.1 antitoxin [Lonepinella koalarum]TYG33742.1 antitoxin [Lonepinella koalarum]